MAAAGSRTRDLLIASPVPYHYTNELHTSEFNVVDYILQGFGRAYIKQVGLYLAHGSSCRWMSFLPLPVTHTDTSGS